MKRGKEKTLTALYDEQCGVMFDYFATSSPLARHSIYDEFVIVSTGFAYYCLRFEDITSAEMKSYWATENVIYKHRIQGYPKTIRITCKYARDIYSILISKGVSVEIDEKLLRKFNLP